MRLSIRPKTTSTAVGAVAAVELDLGRFDDAAAQVDQRAAELGRAKVKADGVAAVRPQPEHDRRLAAGRRAAADFLDEAVADQLANEGGDGRARKARERATSARLTC